MLRRLVAYVKYYNQPKSDELADAAFTSALEYFAGRPRPAAFTTRATEFRAYQRGFVNAYRHNYAKNRLESER
jgi:hypothetical protein